MAFEIRNLPETRSGGSVLEDPKPFYHNVKVLSSHAGFEDLQIAERCMTDVLR